MATARDFIAKIDQLDGVSGCLLIRRDGALLGRTLSDPATYVTLMREAGGQAFEIMETIGFSYCRHLCFNREKNDHFYVFPIDRYLLGVIQRPDCDVAEMLDAVYGLISRVTTVDKSN